MTQISTSVFGTHDGESVSCFRVYNEHVDVSLIEFGACVVSLKFADKDGKIDDVVTGFENVEDYATNDKYFGSIVGRIANRTGKGQFTLNDVPYQLSINNGPNHLHGGFKGFDKKLWKGKSCENGVVFKVTSCDGDEGCPGNLDVIVTYRLIGRTLSIGIQATTDKDTPINLTNHSYFNLSGHSGWGSLDDHLLTIHADHYTPLDVNLVTTGQVLPVEDTIFDLQNPVQLTMARLNDAGNGYDHNFCLPTDYQRHLAARLEHQLNGRVVSMETTQPGMQCYTGNFLEGEVGKSGVMYDKQTAICFEAQNWPDAVNKVGTFPDGVLRVGEVYKRHTWYTFTVRQTL